MLRRVAGRRARWAQEELEKVLKGSRASRKGRLSCSKNSAFQVGDTLIFQSHMVHQALVRDPTTWLSSDNMALITSDCG